MDLIDVDGTSIAVERGGSGPVELVFVHGIRNAAWVWRPVLERLDPTAVRWTAFDLPGCGESETPSTWQDCTIERTAALARRLVEIMCDGLPVLIGHSFGGGVVAQMAVDDPAGTGGVVLVAPTPLDGIASPLDDVLAGAFAEESDVEDLGRAAFVVQPDEERFQKLVATVLAARPEHIEGALRSAHALRIRDRLAVLRLPTMVLAGDHDRHVPPMETYRTAAALHRPAVQIWHDVGHVPQWEVPSQVADLVSRFATQLSAPPTSP